MKDYIKTLDEIKKMKIAGKLASDVLMMIMNHDAHLRANLAPVIGQFGRPEKIKPDKS